MTAVGRPGLDVVWNDIGDFQRLKEFRRRTVRHWDVRCPSRYRRIRRPTQTSRLGIVYGKGYAAVSKTSKWRHLYFVTAKISLSKEEVFRY